MTATSPARQEVRWVGLGPAERRRERRRLLVDAAFDLLGTQGIAATTVRGVCQAARLNPRYFYESFADLDELLVAVYDQTVAELRDGVIAVLDETQADEPLTQLRAAIEHIVGFIDEDRRRARVLYIEALGNEALNRRRIETGHSLVDLVEGHSVASQGPPPTGEVIGKVASAILVGGFAELLAAWHDGRIDLSRRQLVDDATALFGMLFGASAMIARSRAPQPRRRAAR